MAGVRRTRDKTGKLHTKWRLWFYDCEGKRRWRTGTASKPESLAMATRLEEEHRQVRLGFRPRSKASSEQRLFDEAKNEYIAWGEAQGGRNGFPWGPKHAATRRRHLPWWKERLGLLHVTDLTGALPRVEQALRGLKADGKSGKTLQNFSESLAAFCDWCVQRGYLDADPLKGLKKFDRTPGELRRALTLAEVQALLECVPFERRIVYGVALATGLRVRELESLRVRHLDVAQGGLVLEPAWTKNRKGGFQPVPVGLMAELASLAKDKAASEPLLPMPGHAARRLDFDLRHAGIAKWTDEGKVDFHAFRTTYTTLLLDSGAHPKEVQTLLRHSTPEMTMNVYARTRPERLRQVADSLGNAVDLAHLRATSVQRESNSFQGDCVTHCGARTNGAIFNPVAAGSSPAPPTM